MAYYEVVVVGSGGEYDKIANLIDSEVGALKEGLTALQDAGKVDDWYVDPHLPEVYTADAASTLEAVKERLDIMDDE